MSDLVQSPVDSGVNQTDAVFDICGTDYHAEFNKILLSGG